MTEDYNIRPATQEDMVAMFGKLPPYSSKALAVEYKEELVCLAGIMYQPSSHMAFSAIVEDIDVPKKTMWRGALELWEIIKTWEDTLYAVCDKKHPNSPAFLRRLGFQEIQSGVFKWQIQ